MNLKTALRLAQKAVKLSASLLIRAEMEGTEYPNMKPGTYKKDDVIALLSGDPPADVKQFARDFLTSGITQAVVGEDHKVVSTASDDEEEEELEDDDEDEEEEEAEDLIIPGAVVPELLAIAGVEELLKSHGVLE